MGININSNFSVGAPVPIDSRLTLSYEEMASMNDNIMPEVYITVCRTDGEVYVYNKQNEVNNVTGRFVRLIGDGTFGSSVEFYNRTDFPEIGQPNILYIATNDNVIYRYDIVEQQYVQLTTAIIEDDYVKTTDNLILNCTL